MELTINVHVTGLDKLADAIANLSAHKTGVGTHLGAASAPVQSTTLSANNTTPEVPVDSIHAGTPTNAPSQAGADVSINSTPAPVAPATVPAYTVDALAKAAAPLMDDPTGVQSLCNLLAQFGVPSLQQLPEDKYGAFATELRGLGADI